MNINIVLPFENSGTQTKIWAYDEKSINFRTDFEQASRCTLSYGAVEVADHLTKMIPNLNIKFSDVRDEGFFNILLNVKDKSSRNECFSITPIKNGIVITGDGRTGALYGCYEFLNMQGFRWISPEENAVFIPKWQGSLILPIEKKEFKPSMDLGRGFDIEGTLKESTDLWKWMARNKLNMIKYMPNSGGLQNKLGMVFKDGGHVFEEILHPERLMPSGKTLWEEHCEWYGIPKERAKTKETARHVQFCMSNNELLEFLSNELITMLNGRWKEADRLDLWGFDTWGSECNCENCQALGNSTDQYLHFTSYISDALKKAFENGICDRKVKLVMCAYEGTATLLPPTMPIPENLKTSGDYVVYYPILRCYKHEFSDKNCCYNSYYNNVVCNWKDIPIMIGEYYNVSKFEDLPLLFNKTITHDIPYYHSIGIRGATYMHVPLANWGVRALTQVLYAALIWDVNADADKIIDDYFTCRYGIYADKMKKAYALIEEAWEYISSWRSWSKTNVLSYMINWNGLKPTTPLKTDDHLKDNAEDIGEKAVAIMEKALDIINNTRILALDDYLKQEKIIVTVAINPNDPNYKPANIFYESRMSDDMRSLNYGIDTMKLMSAFVSYYNALYNDDSSSDCIWNTIEELAYKMNLYYVPSSYKMPDAEIVNKDAFSRSQLRQTYLRCKQHR